jgi:outer membrane lipoprotein carrier protein
MKKICSLVAVALLLSVGAGYAQDAKATALLDKVSSKVKGMKSLKANFALSIKDAKGAIKDTRKGTFLMKGNKYRVNMAGQEIICNAATVWTYLPANNEVQITAYNPDEQSISPDQLFSGSYAKDYKSKYAGEKIVNGKKVDVIELTPVSGKSFTKVQLYIDKAASMISGGNIYEKSGASYAYSISGVNGNTVLTDKEFNFDTKSYPNVEVIDLR